MFTGMVRFSGATLPESVSEAGELVEAPPHGVEVLTDEQLELTLGHALLLLSVSEAKQFPVEVVKPSLSTP